MTLLRLLHALRMKCLRDTASCNTSLQDCSLLGVNNAAAVAACLFAFNACRVCQLPYMLTGNTLAGSSIVAEISLRSMLQLLHAH
jgi:hypothetical protein